MVMFGMWEEKGSSDTRLLLPPLIPDEYVTVGESIAGREHREHVIPRKVICEECHKLFSAGESTEAIAQFIRKHLMIVYISKQEQYRLDSGKELNLRQRMPDNWSFENGDPFARLQQAGIVIKFNKNLAEYQAQKT